MPPIYIGSNLAKLCVGAQIVSAVYIGSTLAYSSNTDPVAPTNITLSSSSVSESASVGTVVGILGSNGYPSATYSKILDASSKFAIVGNELRIATTLDYETATSHSVTVRATNASGSYDKIFAISAENTVELPANTIAPSISGAPTQGGTLTGADGTWTSAAGAISYARQWLRGGVAISGATGAGYVLTADDVGSMIGYRVTATNSDGSTQTTSATVGPVAALSVAYPLDAITTTPQFAFSTKKIRGAYSGPAVRVLRPSDSVEQDIGYAGQDIDALALDAFLGAETGRVTVWYDQSGNANHAIQSTVSLRPYIESVAIAGSRAVVFNASEMSIPTTAVFNSQGASMYAVYEKINSAFISAVGQLGTGANQACAYVNVAANEIGYYRGSPTPTGISAFKPKTSLVTAEMMLTPTGTKIDVAGEVMTGTVLTSVPMTGGTVGSTSSGASMRGKEYMAAHIGYAAALGSSDASAIKSALGSLFGTTTTPTAHVVFEGDSITAASNLVQTPNYYGYAKIVQRALPNVAFYNVATGGTKIVNELGYYNSQVKPVVTSYTGKRIVFLFMGTNDLFIDGRTSAQIYADIQSYAALVRADGGLIIVSTLTPNKNWTLAQQTTRDELSSLLRTNWPTFADGLADFHANATIGPQAAASNTTLYPDGLHPSRAASQYLAAVATAAISALL